MYARFFSKLLGIACVGLSLGAVDATKRDPNLLAGSERILFQSNRDGNWEVYAMRTDGSEQVNVSRNAAELTVRGDEDVLGLQIAVRDPLGVRGRHGVRNLPRSVDVIMGANMSYRADLLRTYEWDGRMNRGAASPITERLTPRDLTPSTVSAVASPLCNLIGEK